MSAESFFSEVDFIFSVEVTGGRKDTLKDFQRQEGDLEGPSKAGRRP